MLQTLRSLIRDSFYGTLVGLASGCASAIFLLSLAEVTDYREQNHWTLGLLPLMGVLSIELYRRFGNGSERGNNLLLERIHSPGEQVPLRMAPLVLFTTLLTHFGGGSAGREGVAVQMGGSMADGIGRALKVAAKDRSTLLVAGLSGGFGSVFGTPFAGALFGMEVLTVGEVKYRRLPACLAASIVGDIVCRTLGARHGEYGSLAYVHLGSKLLIALLAFGLLCGMASRLFVAGTHAVERFLQSKIKAEWMRPAIGGAVVIALTYGFRTREYLGLGLPLIALGFSGAGVLLYAWLLKMLFTVVTIGSGFKGGEVTPLFAIGATLGTAFGQLLHLPMAHFTAVGFVGVFAGCAKTPLTCALLSIELFGAHSALPALVVCALSYFSSGPVGIYSAQRRAEVN